MNDDYYPLGFAVELITGERSAGVRSTLEAIVGLASKGVEVSATNSQLAGWFRATIFREWADPLEVERAPIVLDPIDDATIPRDFWLPEMVGSLAADDVWKDGNLIRCDELAYSWLPYRMVKTGGGDSARYLHKQAAIGIHLHERAVMAMIQTRDWSPWQNAFRTKRPGPIPKYAWDLMMARLTYNVSLDPKLLNGDLTLLVAEMNRAWVELMELGEIEDSPEHRDIYRYAQTLAEQVKKARAQQAVNKRDFPPVN